MKKSFLFVVLLFVLVGCGSTDSVVPVSSDTATPEIDEVHQNMQLGNDNKTVDLFEETGDLAVTTASVSYYEDTVGYLARPEAVGEYPGVVIIHEWWGLNENIKAMTEKLASYGYNALAVDLYGGEVAEDAGRAGELSGAVRSDLAAAVRNMQAAASYLENDLQSTKLGSLGWCFGGQQSLQLALNEDLDATVIYYGNLVTEAEELASLQSPVLGIFGAEDAVVSVEDVTRFEAALNQLEVENDIYVYDGVGHAFANPSGDNFAPDETKDAWQKTLDFLEDNLRES